MNVSLVLKLGIALLAAGTGVASYTYFRQKEDNHIEELFEEIFEEQTGYDIDFSPLSQEDEEEEK